MTRPKLADRLASLSRDIEQGLAVRAYHETTDLIAAVQAGPITETFIDLPARLASLVVFLESGNPDRNKIAGTIAKLGELIGEFQKGTT